MSAWRLRVLAALEPAEWADATVAVAASATRAAAVRIAGKGSERGGGGAGKVNESGSKVFLSQREAFELDWDPRGRETERRES